MKIALTIALCVVLLSCQKLKYGNIVKMEHQPSTQTLIFIPMQAGKTTRLIPYWIFDNEDWVIDVKGIGSDGDTITRRLYISQQKFDSLRIGSFICVDGMCDEDNNNVKKRK